MKRDFLANLDLGDGAHLSKELIDAIMAENGKDITSKDNAIATLTTERDGLKTQLAAANGEIQSYKDMDIEKIKQSAADWESKYNTDTQKLKDELDAANYGFSVKEAASGLKFTSAGAKKAFISALTEKKLTLQDGKLLGLDDFVKEYKTNDPGTFVIENPDGDGQKKNPQFTNPNAASGKAGEASPFNFGFTAVRQANQNS